MTVSSTVSRNDYLGNGVTKVFAYSFKILAASDLRVVLTDTDGVETVQTLNADYTVSGVLADAGGSVTFTIAPSGNGLDGTSTQVTIRRVVPLTQGTDLRNQGVFAAEVVERALDRLTMIAQQLDEVSDRTLTLSESSSGVSAVLPAPEAGMLLGWNDAEDALENVSVDDLVLDTALGSWIADVFSGTGAQVAFVLTRAPGSLGNLDVSVGGVTMRRTLDFTLSGQTVTFLSPPASGTNNILIRYGVAHAEVTTAFVQQYFTATGGQTAFTMSSAYTVGGNAMAVYQNGSRLTPGEDYTETNTTTVTLAVGATAGDRLLFVYGAEVNNDVVTTINLADGSVTTPKLAASAVTTAKIADANVTAAKIDAAGVTMAKLGLGTSAVTINGATTATLNRLHYIIDNGGPADYTITLPAASTAGSLLWFNVGPIAVATKNFTLDGAGAETIDGSTTVILRAGDSILLISDGTNWRSLSRDISGSLVAVTAATTAIVGATHKISGTSASYTIDLPDATTCSGKSMTFSVAPWASANKQYTLDGNGAQTIDGVATLALIHTNSITLVSDGANWFSTQKSLDTPWINNGAVTFRGTTTNPTKGTAAVDSLFWRRVGDSAEMRVQFRKTGGLGVAGTGDYSFEIPTLLVIDTAKVTDNTTVGERPFSSVGSMAVSTASNYLGIYNAEVYNSTRIRGVGQFTTSAPATTPDVWGSASPVDFNNAAYTVAARISVPIVGW